MIRMKYERLKRGWRQEDLGFYARIAGADISRIEIGRLKPYPTHIERLCKVLGLAPEELLEEVDSAGVEALR